MLVTADAIGDQLYDLIIVGSGFAGCSIAERLASTARILLIEQGSTEFSDGSSGEYYNLVSTGLPYPDLGTRLAMLGGTSGHWGGQSFPLSPEVFVSRRNVAGWPIAYGDFAYYLPLAASWLNLGTFHEDATSRTAPLNLLPYTESSGIDVDFFRVSRPIVRLAESGTARKFADSSRVDVLLETRLVDIILSNGTTRVEQLRLASTKSGATFEIGAPIVVLCTGGIETPRLMRWAGRNYSTGNPLHGGAKDWTGKCFMEHPHISPLEVFFDGRVDLATTNWHPIHDWSEGEVWRVNDVLSQQLDLPRFGAFFWNAADMDFDTGHFDAADSIFINQADRYSRVVPTLLFEQLPSTESFVSLHDTELDAAGVPLPRLHWTVGDEEIDSYRRAAIAFGGLLSQSGLARVRLREGYRDEWRNIDIGFGCHHMGTTRMASSSRHGVVDENCKVFGLDNLFIAGSSVFPTSDYVNPTLNLVALGLRLADHLRTRHLNPLDPTELDIASADVLDFGAGRSENILLLEGWSHPELDAVWSDGDVAVIGLAARPAKSMIFRGRGFADATVTVRLPSGTHLYSGPVATLADTPIALPAGTKLGTLTLAFSGLRSPKEIDGGGDSRRLGFFLDRLEIERE